jgi:hypothetical protein
MPYPLPRRTLLRSATVAVGLPLLDAMIPTGLRANQQEQKLRVPRMLLIGRPLGLHAPYFFPQKAGHDYEPTRYLKPLDTLRRDFTVFSGISHLGYRGGHDTIAALFTGVGPDGMRSGDVRNTISLDQEVATRLGSQTRFASLQWGGDGLSWNSAGVKVPGELSAMKAFKNLFMDGKPDEVQREVERIEHGLSILDGVRDQARSLASALGSADRQRLDLLLTSIREAEQRLQQDQAWVRKPKPKVEAKPPTNDHLSDSKLTAREQQWLALSRLAFQTDSTRCISLLLWSHAERPDLPGITMTHHDASHHGQDESKIAQLGIVEEAEMRLFADFLKEMKATDESGTPLLDNTTVLFASNLGNASAHTSDNLPVILAGGGFKHGQHIAFDRKKNRPLSDLFVRMLQQMGIEKDQFGSSTGQLTEV